jgi:hypothetical protein
MVELNWLHLTNKNTVTWNYAKNTITMLLKYVKFNEDEYFDKFMTFINIFQNKFDD